MTTLATELARQRNGVAFDPTQYGRDLDAIELADLLRRIIVESVDLGGPVVIKELHMHIGQVNQCNGGGATLNAQIKVK